jgi:hypothetical protein
MVSIEQAGAPKLSPAVNAEQDHVLGQANAPITLVEYGDFECPFCGRSYPAVRRIRGELVPAGTEWTVCLDNDSACL